MKKVWLYHTTAGLTTSGICDDGSEPYLERHTPKGGGEGQTEGGGTAAGSTTRRRIHVRTHQG